MAYIRTNSSPPFELNNEVSQMPMLNLRLLGKLLMTLIVVPTLTFGQRYINGKFRIEIEKTVDTYKPGQPIIVLLTITNVTDSVQSIEFTETHKYHKTLPYATCITASIYDLKGRSRCKYPTQYIKWSTLFTEEDLKYLNIKPKEKITRYLSVTGIADDCDCIQDKGLVTGTYLVSLGVHEQMTNELRIEVK